MMVRTAEWVGWTLASCYLFRSSAGRLRLLLLALTQVCIVTGASSGLGDRFARVLHANGAIVVACARRLDRLEALAAECDGLVAVKCDVTVDDDRQGLVEAAL
jgi:NADP-dependent 3-hydroxy acid dehydrogenase YdfG